MNDKSIIGFGYTPNNAKAVCLKTNSETRLGAVEYKIIADPYEREFVELVPVPLSFFGEKKKVPHNAMAVNVLDAATGLTYAVEYAPANLVRPPKEYKWSDVEILVGGGRLPVVTIDRATENKGRYKYLQAMIEDDIARMGSASWVVLPKKPGKLIGSNYNPTNLKALDLDTHTSANLGSRKYRVVTEPYTKKYGTPKNIVLDLLPVPWNIERVWIDIVDPVTERKYAVEFVPARVRKNDEPAERPFGGSHRDLSFDNLMECFFGKATSAATKKDDKTGPQPDKSSGQRPAAMNPDTFLRRMKEIAQEIDEITDENPDLLANCSVAFFAAKRADAGVTTNGVSRLCGKPKMLIDSIFISAKKSKAVADVICKTANSLSAWRLMRRLAQQHENIDLF